MSEQNQFETHLDSEPRDKQLSQAELFILARDNLITRLADHKIKCTKEGDYLRLKRNNKQVGIIFKMPDGNRTVVRFDSDLQTIIEEFESSVPPESIFNISRYTDETDFTFYPNLTEEQVTVLRTEIEPIAEHIVIVQGEYVVASKQDKNHLISTFVIGPCKGIIIYEPEKGIAAIAHLDIGYAVSSLIQQMRIDLIKAGADPARLKFYGTPNIDWGRYTISNLFPETSYKIPSDFTFDCTTGLITPFDLKSLPQAADSANLDQRMEEEIAIRLEHHIPYIRKNVK